MTHDAMGAGPPEMRPASSSQSEVGPGWVIRERACSRRAIGRLHVRTVFPSQAAAERELRELLRPYPPSDPWRRRLFVAPSESKMSRQGVVRDG